MKIANLRFHLNIICDGFIFILRMVLLQILTILTSFVLTAYNLRRLPKVKWELNLTRRNFLEFFAVSINVFIFFLMLLTVGLCISLLLIYLSNYGRIALVSYWIYVYHHHMTTLSLSAKIGCMRIRKNFLGRYSRSYYPVELIKTAELEPNRNYMIASFPHGIMGFCAANNMLFDIGKWMSLFPGVRPMMATLDLNFCMPILRNVLHAIGVISTSKDALLHYLSQSNDTLHPANKDGFTSNAIGLVVGGAKEAECAFPGTYQIFLRNRKGFIKVAILSGCCIVPSFSFGEVELFDQIIFKRGTFFHRYQCFFKKTFGLWPSILIGRGFLQAAFGLLPRKKRLVQVVGAPIDVVQSDIPDPKYVDEIHKQFIEAIAELFESHKRQYLDDYEKAKLVIN